jgi:hypothetical protein
LTASPFSLLKGYSINIQVIASNAYGNSLISLAGSGAVIVLVPDAPISLLNDASVTSTTQIKFAWSNGASNGGQSIVDYRITYDQSTGNYVTLATGVTERFTTTVVPITAGASYKFKVEARNSVGYSSFSSVVTILAAEIPD